MRNAQIIAYHVAIVKHAHSAMMEVLSMKLIIYAILLAPSFTITRTILIDPLLNHIVINALVVVIAVMMELVVWFVQLGTFMLRSLPLANNVQQLA